MYDKSTIRFSAVTTAFMLAVVLSTCSSASPQTKTPVATFSGICLDQYNNPVAGATVHVLIYNSADPTARPARKITATTDSAGAFAVDLPNASEFGILHEASGIALHQTAGYLL
jgi:hypothetical protein